MLLSQNGDISATPRSLAGIVHIRTSVSCIGLVPKSNDVAATIVTKRLQSSPPLTNDFGTSSSFGLRERRMIQDVRGVPC